MRSKEVQIIPWVIGDSNYVRCPSQRLDPQVEGHKIFFYQNLLKTVLFFRRLSWKFVFVKLKNATYLQNTVFVGALHGMLNAEGLAHIFNDLFGGVVYAGIDTDKVNCCFSDISDVSCVRFHDLATSHLPHG
jgi:cytoplasmic polyadenylation element-binding protein